MLRDRGEYEASLEAFSRPLVPLIEYSLDDEGRMTVQNETARWYRYIDFTAQTEALFRFVERTIDAELAEELARIIHERGTSPARCAMVTRSVSEANSVGHPRLRFGLRLARE
jgi:hypothetical protein